MVTPFFFGAVIALYCLIMLARIRHKTDATPQSHHQRQSALRQLRRKVASVGATLFTVGAIFFVKSFLRGFDCVRRATDNAVLHEECSADRVH